MKWVLAILLVGLILDLALGDSNFGHRGGRRLRTRGRGRGRRINAAAAALGPPPQPEVVLPPSAQPLPIAHNSAPRQFANFQPEALPEEQQFVPAAQVPVAVPQAQPLRRRPAHGGQLPRGGRQFDSSSDEATFQGSTPDEGGNYNFQFSTDDGSFRQETGSATDEANEISGEVSWTSPEGEQVSFSYLGDRNGYHAEGSHIPQPPPIPPAIQRALDLIARANSLV